MAFCSAAAVTAGRTLPRPGADEVREPNSTALDGELLLSWQEPLHPNGLLVAYHVRYRYRYSDVAPPQVQELVSKQNNKVFKAVCAIIYFL